MKFSQEQISKLLGAVVKTSAEEISCQTCEDQIAEFAESQSNPKLAPDAMQAIEEHLKACPECAEELDFIRRALESENDA